MCTVSFIPTNAGVIISSNRDEKKHRTPALPPQKFATASTVLYYPVDGKAGGTWFVANEKGDAGVLLNGAFEKHLPKENYKTSRGSILQAIFCEANPLKALQEFDLTNIENCTLVLYTNKQLHVCRWDGNNLAIKRMDESKPHIWSSVTLYSDTMISERQQWFNHFMGQHKNPSQQNAIAFHSLSNNSNKEYGLQINREEKYLTVSITSLFIEKSNAHLFYRDCIQQQTFSINIHMLQFASSLL